MPDNQPAPKKLTSSLTVLAAALVAGAVALVGVRFLSNARGERAFRQRSSADLETRAMPYGAAGSALPAPAGLGQAAAPAVAAAPSAGAMNGLQSPVAGLQSPVAGLQSPVAGLQSPVAGLQSLVAGLQPPSGGCAAAAPAASAPAWAAQRDTDPALAPAATVTRLTQPAPVAAQCPPVTPTPAPCPADRAAAGRVEARTPTCPTAALAAAGDADATAATTATGVAVPPAALVAPAAPPAPPLNPAGLVLTEPTQDAAALASGLLTLGVTVTAVTPGGLAYQAGLARGDRVVSVAGQPVASVFHFFYLLAQVDGADKTKLVAVRGGKPVSFSWPARAGTTR